MNRTLIDYLRQWRPDILRWIAAILIFAVFAWVMLDYFGDFDSCLNNASCDQAAARENLSWWPLPRRFRDR